MKLKYIIIILLFALFTPAQGKTLRAFFIGNSYTGMWNMPQIVSEIALSMSDTLIYDAVTPDGNSLEQHCNNKQTISKLKAGNWDYVIIQEQSQRPAKDYSTVKEQTFPYAKILDSLAKLHNPCCQTIYYMTWGRKNGDKDKCGEWPPVCTYRGMDSLLQLRYSVMAELNKGMICPVGPLRKYLRENNPEIELYYPDGSHPSQTGAFAAALSFYTVIFRKDPTNVSYNYLIDGINAATVKKAVKTVVYDKIETWRVGRYDVLSNFTTNYLEKGKFEFINLSQNASEYFWDFGNENNSVEFSPAFAFTSPGIYNIKLTAGKCKNKDTIQYSIIWENDNKLDYYVMAGPKRISRYLYLKSNIFEKEKYSISILDLFGNILLNKELELNSEQNADLGLVPKGDYILELKSSSGKKYNVNISKLR